VLRGVVADMQHASKADIVSIFLYEESTRTYYAPFATGQPQESLLDSLTDMREQLARYSSDMSQGKVPDDIAVHHYGSTVWLTVTRQKLIARDAPSEIDSTFIRRYQIQATIGLPLLAGDRFLGLIYLNYRGRDQAPDGAQLAELERRTAGAAAAVAAVLAAAERSALDGVGRLAALLTAPAGDERTDIKEIRRLLSIALAELLLASELDGAAIYQFASQRTSLDLVTAHAPVAAPPRIDRTNPAVPWPSVLMDAVAAATATADLHPVATYALGNEQEPHGYLVVMSRDRLATVRRAPATDLLLKAGAELIGSSLASQRLIAELENSNRLLGALANMTTAMLKPGGSRQDVLEAVAGHLTDATVPEFDFHFASVYLLEERADEVIVIRKAAGAATSAAVDSAEASKGGARRARVPRWILEEERELAPDDVLVFVARNWQVAVVGPLPVGETTDRADVVAGTLPTQATWSDVPVVRNDGTVLAHVAACAHRWQRGHPRDASGRAAVHARRRGVRKERACGPHQDLSAVRFRPQPPRDRRPRGRVSPLARPQARLGSDRGAARGSRAGGCRGRDGAAVRRGATPWRGARVGR